jgi:hypothetical protein
MIKAFGACNRPNSSPPVRIQPTSCTEEKKMKKHMAAWSVVLGFVVLASPALTTTAGAQDTPQAVDPNNQNIQAYIALLRSDVRQQKAEAMGAVMQLSSADAAKFWPIYNEYDAELNKLNEARVANIQEYARTYDQMTDEKADELIQKAMTYRKQRAELLAKYYGMVKAQLGAITAARFVQVEDQLLLLIDLQIDSQLPVVGQSS